MKDILLVIWIATMLSLFVISIVLIFRGNRVTMDLHDEADRIEKRIKAGEDYDSVFDEFITFYDKARKSSGCSRRTWELAKMIEAKYDVDIIEN